MTSYTRVTQRRSSSSVYVVQKELNTFERSGPLSVVRRTAAEISAAQAAEGVPELVPTPEELGFLRACRKGLVCDIRTMLLNDRFLINAQDLTGRTGLSYASSDGQVTVIQVLSEVPGLDVNLADSEGTSPLMMAAQAGHVEALTIMLERFRGQVNVDQRNVFGLTALMKSALQGKTRCLQLLLGAGANPFLRDPGRRFTALEWARFCGRVSCAEALDKYLKSSSTCKPRRSSDWELADGILSPPPCWLAKDGDPRFSRGESWLKQRLRKAKQQTVCRRRASEIGLLSNTTAAAMMCASSAILPNSVPDGLPKAPAVGKGTPPKVEVTQATVGDAATSSGKDHIFGFKQR